MNSKQFFFVLIAVIVLLVGGGAATLYFGNKILSQQSTKLVDLKLESQLLNSQQTALQTANKDILTYSKLETIAKTIVPQDKDQARAVREIVKIAEDSGVKLKSITFPSSTLGQAPAAKPAAPPTDNNAQSPTTAAPATPPAAAATPTISQVKPVDGIAGIYVMEINIQSDDTKPIAYNTFINFLKRLEQNRRTAQVANIAIQPKQPENVLLTFTLTVNLYIRP